MCACHLINSLPCEPCEFDNINFETKTIFVDNQLNLNGSCRADFLSYLHDLEIKDSNLIYLLFNSFITYKLRVNPSWFSVSKSLGMGFESCFKLEVRLDSYDILRLNDKYNSTYGG